MENASVNRSSEGKGIENIYIPYALMPATGYGEIKLTIVNGKIVDCKTTTSYKIIEDLKRKRE